MDCLGALLVFRTKWYKAEVCLYIFVPWAQVLSAPWVRRPHLSWVHRRCEGRHRTPRTSPSSQLGAGMLLNLRERFWKIKNTSKLASNKYVILIVVNTLYRQFNLIIDYSKWIRKWVHVVKISYSHCKLKYRRQSASWMNIIHVTQILPRKLRVHVCLYSYVFGTSVTYWNR